ncbi:MAG: hypothetical protein WA173_08860 [Pseudomonas sp.]|uniref:hypothetical protein n=1 Tax=Pseudomonas sp. TaxID=306 RepID=UPI003BB723DB
MQPARQDLPVTPGTTYRDIVRLMQPEFAYHAITQIAGAPVLFTVPAHGLAADWLVWVRGVAGMPAANAEPQRQNPHRAKRLDQDTLEINNLSADGLNPTGGQLIYRLPVDLAGAAVAMRFLDKAGAELLALSLGSGLVIIGPGTIARELTPAQTGLLRGACLTYEFDVIYADGTVTRYYDGAIT